jgi:hypothetical protein
MARNSLQVFDDLDLPGADSLISISATAKEQAPETAFGLGVAADAP